MSQGIPYPVVLVFQRGYRFPAPSITPLRAIISSSLHCSAKFTAPRLALDDFRVWAAVRGR
jgi:hypothetical protein